MNIESTITVLNSKTDKNGNRYWAFVFVNHKTGTIVKANFSGGESNINGIARHWNKSDDWDRSIQFIYEEMGYQAFNKLTKDWAYAGCGSKEIADYIKGKLKKGETVEN